MTTVDEHADRIWALLEPLSRLGSETISVTEALGRTLAVDVVSSVDLPLFRNSQMDGYAAIAADLVTVPVTMPVATDIAAGPVLPWKLERGTLARIMTGAVVPGGADCIVPIEHTAVEPDGTVTIATTRVAGDYVRERGSDIRAGARLLDDGQLLASRHLAVLAAAGITTIDVHRRPHVAVITTGAELVNDGASPALGQIFDANQIALVAAITESGAAATYTARCSDDVPEFMNAMQEAAAASDVIVTSGGVSMGAHEVVKDALEPIGVRFGTVAMQPGGPQGIGVFEGTPVLCFPGNPVSTQVSFAVFLRPILDAAVDPASQAQSEFGSRERWRAPRSPTAINNRILEHEVTSVEGKRQFLRGFSDGDTVRVVSGASSHLVAAMARANVLVDIATEAIHLDAGARVRVWKL